MLLDSTLLLSDDQAITTTAASTNKIDLGNDNAAVQPLNEKGEITLLCQVTEDFAGGTSLQVAVRTDDDSAFGSPTTLFTSAAIATASLVAGYQFPVTVKLPRINEQYLDVNYVVVGTHTAGKMTTGLVLDVQSNGH